MAGSGGWIFQFDLMTAVLWGKPEVNLLFMKVLGLEEKFGGETLVVLGDGWGRERQEEGGESSSLWSSTEKPETNNIMFHKSPK